MIFFLAACQSSSLSGSWHITETYKESLVDSSLSMWDPDEVQYLEVVHSMVLEEGSAETHFQSLELALELYGAQILGSEQLEDESTAGAVYCYGSYDFGFYMSGSYDGLDAQSSTEHMGEIFVIDRRAISTAGPRPGIEVLYVGAGPWGYSYGEQSFTASRVFSGSYSCTGPRGQVGQLQCSHDYASELLSEMEVEGFIQFDLSR